MSTFRQDFSPPTTKKLARDDNLCHRQYSETCSSHRRRRPWPKAEGSCERKCKMTQGQSAKTGSTYAESHLMSLDRLHECPNDATARDPPRGIRTKKKNPHEGLSSYPTPTNAELFLADQDSLCTSLMTSEITPPAAAGPRDGPTLTAATLSLGGGGGAGSSLIHAVSSRFVHFPLVPA